MTSEWVQRVREARNRIAEALLAGWEPEGHWTGELSSSALSTATAVIALTAVQKASDGRLVEGGLSWLASCRNPDGGWGDTVRSRSNPSTTALAWAAFGAAGVDARFPDIVAGAEGYLRRELGLRETGFPRGPNASAGSPGTDASGAALPGLVPAIEALYGKDRTFSVPITMALALSGRLGRDGWRSVRPLPFEWAALPRGLFGALRLPVVSYALPALIAIGQVIHQRSGRFHPLRDLTRRRTLEVLVGLQPRNGGFLEATPLTSFVTMSLAGMGLSDHVVARRGADFLRKSVRSDGSWPIDTNLATWVSTLAVKALRGMPQALNHDRCRALRRWLLGQQYRVTHPYTGAAPGGWAWTDLPGGVPDADDTAGALVALHALGEPDAELMRAVEAGVDWLLDLQNGDGGVPTFCRGWGTLPFDRSTPELTAHALRAWAVWLPRLAGARVERIQSASSRALRYLARVQRADGAWLPLWFGNEGAVAQQNPVYGTAQTLIALNDRVRRGLPLELDLRQRAGRFLAAVQHPSGGWGGDTGVPPTIEETAVAVEALAGIAEHSGAHTRGLQWLVERFGRSHDAPGPTDRGTHSGGTPAATDRRFMGSPLFRKEPPTADEARTAVEGELAASGPAGVAQAVSLQYRGLPACEGGQGRTGSEGGEEGWDAAPIGLYFARLWYFERMYPLVFAGSALAASLESASERG